MNRILLNTFLAATCLFSFVACDDDSAPRPRPGQNVDPRRFVDGQEGLCSAVSKNNVGDASYFLNRKVGLRASPNIPCPNFNYQNKPSLHASPIFLAIEMGHSIVLELLLQNGGNANLKEDGVPALIKAVAVNKADLVRILLKYGADVKATFSVHGKSVSTISAAMDNENSQILELLLQNGGDANQQQEGVPALIRAIFLKNEELVKTLLKHGADANATVVTEGKVISAIECVIYLKLYDVYDLLIAHGAKLPESNSAPKVPNPLQVCLNNFVDEGNQLHTEHESIRSNFKTNPRCDYNGFLTQISKTENVLFNEDGTRAVSDNPQENCPMNGDLRTQVSKFAKAFSQHLRALSSTQHTDKCTLLMGEKKNQCIERGMLLNRCLELGRNTRNLSNGTSQ